MSEPSAATSRDSRYSFAFLIAVALTALAVGITVDASHAFDAPVVAVLLVFSASLALARPALFLLIAVSVYSVGQDQLSRLSLLPGGSVDLNVSQIYILGLTAILLLALGSRAAFDRSIIPTGWGIGAHVGFVAWAGALTLAAGDSRAIATLARVSCCLAIYVVGYWLAKEWPNSDLVPLSLTAAAMAAGFSSAFEAQTAASPLEAISVGAYRAGGSFAGPVSTATNALVGIPIFTEWVVQPSKPYHRLVGFLGLVAVALAVGTTLTRTAIVGMAIFIVLAGWHLLAHRRTAERIIFLLIPTAFLLGGYYLVPTEYVAARVADIPGLADTSGLNPNYGSGRFLLWSGMLRIQADSTFGQWIGGHGVDSVLRDLPQVTGVAVGGHNSYMELVYQVGLIGTGLFVILTWFDIRNLRITAREIPSLTLRAQLWFAYYVAFLLSALMFNGYVWVLGARWLTLLGIGWVAGLARAHSEKT